MERAEAITRLKEFEPALRAMGADALYLFGSTARQDQHAQSDVDLFIDIGPGWIFTLLDLAAAQRLLAAGLETPTDLTTRDGLHPMLKDQVLSEAIRVF